MSLVLPTLSEVELPLSLSVNPVVPVMLEVKLKSWLIPRGSVCLMIWISPQLLTCTGSGATKSLTSAEKELEERLFRKALPKVSHGPVVDVNTPAAVRLIAASPKVPAGRVIGAL